MSVWKQLGCAGLGLLAISWLAMGMAVAAEKQSGFEAWWGAISMLSLLAAVVCIIFAVIMRFEGE